MSNVGITRVFSFRAFHVLLLSLTACMGSFLLVAIAQSLLVTGDSIYPESAGVLAAHRWVIGFPLYQDYRQSPYLVTPFPPLWYALLFVPAKLFTLDLDSLTLWGRILSLAFLLGICGLAYFWNRRLGFPGLFALLSPAFYLSFPIVTPWAVNARPDFPALFFSLAAIFWAGTRFSTGFACLAGVASAVAFLMRHNSVAAPIAIVLWLLWLRRWKHATCFCVVWICTVVAILEPAYRASNGLLLLNLSGAKFGPLAGTYIRDVISRLFSTEGFGFSAVLAAFGACAFLESIRQKDTRIHLLSFYVAVSLGLAIVGSAAAGAHVNHYLEFGLAMALLVPFSMKRLEISWKGNSALTSLTFILLLVILLPSIDTQRSRLMHTKRAQMQRVLPLIANRSVFTDLPYLAARTTSPHLVDLASLINTERVGGWAAWSSSGVVKKLNEKTYELVILSQPVEALYVSAGLYPRWPRVNSSMQKAIRENYALCLELNDVHPDGPLQVYERRLPNSDSSCLSVRRF